MQAWNDYFTQHKERFLNELLELLRIPSISADSKYKGDVARCAEAVKDSLLQAGCDHAEICPTEGHPIVYGEKIIDPSLPTVLVYGHYDVQPADPLELWHSGPFDPVIKDGKIWVNGEKEFARRRLLRVGDNIAFEDRYYTISPHRDEHERANERQTAREREMSREEQFDPDRKTEKVHHNKKPLKWSEKKIKKKIKE